MLLQELNFHVHLFGFQGRSAKRPSSQIGVSVFNRCLYQLTTAADNFDEEKFVCLFTVEEALNASFWNKIEGANIERSTYPAYYQTRS